ncbi:hypothetical protein ACSVDM_11255 [Nocardia sp. JW2]|uniref:hypothetical protein n=1 Tax=Nocardia sp. JW2 TaxID=3450738 RepID=UPI003F4243F6
MTVEIAVTMLVAWAIGKAGRVRQPINGITGRALDLAIDGVREAVVAKLGGDPAVQQLFYEARATDGAVSAETHVAVERSISAAVAADSRFGAELARLTATPAPSPVPSDAGSRTYSGNFGVAGDIHASGPVNVRNKVVNQARRHPVLATFVVIGVVTLLGFSANQLTSQQEAQQVGGAETMSGAWSASDGTGTKTFGSDGGACDGFYYSNGRPLDIGGPMTCSMSSKPDAEGRYSLRVVQSSNRATYLVVFSDADHASVFDTSGAELYDLERF